jgi:hypothetical protein
MDWNDDFSLASVFEWYNKGIKEAEKKYPDLPDKSCPRCGWNLVRGSVGYQEGFHFDGCPNEED